MDVKCSPKLTVLQLGQAESAKLKTQETWVGDFGNKSKSPFRLASLKIIFKFSYKLCKFLILVQKYHVFNTIIGSNWWYA